MTALKSVCNLVLYYLVIEAMDMSIENFWTVDQKEFGGQLAAVF